MSRLVFLVDGSSATAAQALPLSAAGIKERQVLQEWVIGHAGVLGSDVLVVTAEFDQWSSDAGGTARERLDVRGLDASGLLARRCAASRTPEAGSRLLAARPGRCRPVIRSKRRLYERRRPR